MSFVWKMPKDKKPSFDDKVHNIACFEVVLNILKMKLTAGEDIEDEVQALCGFALECMFGDVDLGDDKMLLTVNAVGDDNLFPNYPHSVVYKLYESLPDDIVVQYACCGP